MLLKNTKNNNYTYLIFAFVDGKIGKKSGMNGLQGHFFLQL